MDITTPGSFWCELSVFLEREGIAFRQIGPELDSGARSTDVDIVSSVEHWNSIPESVEEFCRTTDARLLRVGQPSHGTFRFLLGTYKPEGHLNCLQLSATSHLFVGSRRCMDAATLVAESDSPGVRFAYHMLRSVSWGTFPPGRFELLAELLRRDRAQVLQWSGCFWSESDVSALVANLEASDMASLIAALPRLRKAAARRGDRVREALAHQARQAWQRMRHPSGVIVAVLGPDGSGKTSVIDGLAHELTDTLAGPLHIHFRPKFGEPQNPHLKSQHPHSRAPRGLARSLLKASYYAYDMIVSYIAWIRPRLVENELVIFDRYFHDLLIDPVRYRYGGPAWAVKLLDRVIPKPDLLIIMDAPASVIQERVQEVTPEETFRQCAAYRGLADQYASVRLIDAAKDPLNVSHQARAVVVDHLERIATTRLNELDSDPVAHPHTNANTAAAASLP